MKDRNIIITGGNAGIGLATSIALAKQAKKLSQKLKFDVQLADVEKLVDICIANEWLERTTADPNYKYLSLTNDGLEMAIAQQYRRK